MVREKDNMRLTISALFFLAVALAAAPAGAYCLYTVSGTKPYVSWQSQPVTYHVSSNLKDTKYLAAIDKAFATWEAVKCSKLKFTKGAPFTICADKPCKAFTNSTKAIYIYWFTQATDLLKNTSTPTVPYASLTFLFHDKVGGIAGASIGVNGYFYKFATTGAGGVMDVQNEMTAWIGAVIGLDDSKVKTATMYNKITYGDTSKRALDQDDINGVTYLYKATGCPSPPPPGKGGCSGTTKVADQGGVTLDQGGVTLDQGTSADQGKLKLDTAQSEMSGKDQSQGESGPSPDSGQQKADTGGGCTKHSQCAADEICTIEGKCVKKGGKPCTKESDCSEDELCTINGQCVSRVKEDEGCSCQLGGTAHGALPLLLGVLLLALRRRGGVLAP